MKKEKPKLYCASWSGGKDSMGTVLLALKHNEPLDRVVFSEVMFDNEKGISGEIPEHANFIHNVAIPKLESMGLKVDVLRSDIDYKWFFTNKLKNGGRFKGRLYGFPIGGMCVINRDCKIKPIKDYYKQFEDYEIVQYVGIAKDEHIRLARLKNNQVSLLAKYGYTEKMAYDLCKECDLLSPIYENGTRNGCFFCPNEKIPRFVHLRKHHPEIWREMQELSKTPNLCSYGFKYGKTLQEIEKEMDNYEWEQEHQLKLF